MKMDASTQTEVRRKNFAQQTDGGEGEWVNEDKEVEIVREIKGRKDEADVTIIAVFCPIASNKKTRHVKTQTTASTKEKGIQTEWILYEIEIEDSRKASREKLLQYIARQQILLKTREEFQVVPILSPIREYADRAEEWKSWGAGEFRWDEDEKENAQNNNNNHIDKNIDEKKRTNDDEEKKQTKRIKEEAERKDKENIENENDNNVNKRKKTINDHREKQTKRIKREVEIENKGNNVDNNDVNNEKKRKRNDDDGQTNTKKIRREIKQQDLNTLNGTNWLNDEIINNYFELVSNKDTFTMNSFFFPRLHVNGYNAVKRWTKKINIFKYRKVIVPIHLGNHWCLAVIDMLFGEICYYDSFKGSQPAYLATLLEYLVQEAQEKNEVPINKEEWTLGNKTNIPCQTNGYDCGVFTCQFARYEAANRAIDFTQQDMPQIRAKMARELQAGCLED
ncbi:sentrin-specific protease 1-like [Venturia canescens]|uniref:sentrin-specific protease 1-like n=1 Tax=Venturia canescens TaxID=32260 RepID=UPI001C9BDA01|nr:sentrin-specific protease 1-like [Venturia canescens]